ncbi:hypothetical protein AVEN_267139-1 [Araneus ventricosus]|uniref:Uncharacterized protein n=1 Tax=Araneus ventricosus TaxID=182803 RepID=A0A4Y2GD15_ARAVE|nr:hypothetical protein AVEN_267139-1 [Araneus ventricosus]
MPLKDAPCKLTCSEIPVPKPLEKLEDNPGDSQDEGQAYDENFHGVSYCSEPQTFSQLELNDLVRDLGRTLWL